MKYICKIATREELLKRWEYLIKIHPGKNKWVEFRDKALRCFDEDSAISYIGILNDKIICEITAYTKESAFIGDISEPSGLLSDKMSYLAAFRVDKEYEGKGYFSKLYKFVENDLEERGYTELSLGVDAENVRNNEIYAHLGFTEFIKSLIEYDDGKEEQVDFYKKNL